jgi:hypothetical protein
MDRQYLHLLDWNLRQLVDEIEEAAENEIEIQVDPDRAERPGELDALACSFEGRRCAILLPAAEYFPTGSVLHELLHLKRFIVDEVPRLTVCEDAWDPHLEQGFIALDNDLEHLVIVPQEIVIRPERRDRWIRLLQRRLDWLYAEQNLFQVDRDRFFLRWSLFASHALGDEALQRRMEDVVAERNLAARLVDLRNRVLNHIDSKEQMCRGCLAPLQLEGFPACLEYLDEHQVVL